MRNVTTCFYQRTNFTLHKYTNFQLVHLFSDCAMKLNVSLCPTKKKLLAKNTMTTTSQHTRTTVLDQSRTFHREILY